MCFYPFDFKSGISPGTRYCFVIHDFSALAIAEEYGN